MKMPMTDNNKSASAFAEVDYIDIIIVDACNLYDRVYIGYKKTFFRPSPATRFLVQCPICEMGYTDLTVAVSDTVHRQAASALTPLVSCGVVLPYDCSTTSSRSTDCSSSFVYEIRVTYLSQTPA